MTKPLNIGMAGCGFMGRAHSNAYHRVNQFFDVAYRPVLKALAVTTKERGEEFARRWGWQRVESDWRKLVEAPDIDLIDICSPNHTHHAIALAAAARGKMILCEKPLAMNLQQGREMTEAVEKSGRPNMVSFNYRRVPAISLAKQIIEEGRLGRIFHYRATYLQDWTISANVPVGGRGTWRLDKDIAGAGVSGDLSTHNIDTALWLNGPVSQVCGNPDCGGLLFGLERRLHLCPAFRSHEGHRTHRRRRGGSAVWRERRKLLQRGNVGRVTLHSKRHGDCGAARLLRHGPGWLLFSWRGARASALGDTGASHSLAVGSHGRNDLDGIIRKSALLHWLRVSPVCRPGSGRHGAPAQPARLEAAGGGKLGISHGPGGFYLRQCVDALLHDGTPAEGVHFRLADDGGWNARLSLVSPPHESVVGAPLVGAHGLDGGLRRTGMSVLTRRR